MSVLVLISIIARAAVKGNEATSSYPGTSENSMQIFCPVLRPDEVYCDIIDRNYKGNLCIWEYMQNKNECLGLICQKEHWTVFTGGARKHCSIWKHWSDLRTVLMSLT